MRGYLSVVGASSGELAVEDRVAIYRAADESHEVVAVADGREHRLDVADPTVSRRDGEQAPVVVTARSECLEVRNEHNTNGVTVQTAAVSVEIDEGEVERVRRDGTVEIGYRTELELTVEREAKTRIEGDYVAGDKNSTEIVDSVVNRSDVGAGSDGASADGAGATGSHETVVDDSVVNRSDVGGAGGTGDARDERAASGPDRHSTDAGDRSGSAGEQRRGGSGGSPRRSDGDATREYCERHQRAYSDVCPECAAERDDDAGESKFCLYCGEEIPARAAVCSSCGEEQ